MELPPPLDAPREAPTPGSTTVEDVASVLGVAPGALIKAMPVVVEDDRGLVMVLVRGDHRLNEIKLTNHLGAPFRPAREEEIADRIGPVGFIGPVGLDASIPVIKDAAISGAGLVCGANAPDAHLIGVEPGRDFEFSEADVRTVEPGDTTDAGDPIEILPAIEIGNIFKLGTRYSEPLGATYLDPEGTERPVVMGCYGIGPARIAAAAIEQLADERGIVWPASIAPWQVHVVALGKPGDEVSAAAEALYEELTAAGIETVLDDRETRRHGREADRRGAARLPAAAGRRQARAGGRHRRGAVPRRRPRGASRAFGGRRGRAGAARGARVGARWCRPRRRLANR